MLFLGYAALLLCWTCCTAQRAKLCDYPVIENGKLKYDIRFHFPKRVGQSVDYYCFQDYSTLTGNTWGRSFCSLRGWSPAPKCLKKCYTRQLINGYFPRHPMDFYKEGERTTYACNNYFQTEHDVVMCTKNGWFPHPRCIPEKKCRPNYVENGHFTSSRTEFRLREVAPYRCNTGFVTAVGQEKGETHCQEHGWAPPPKCIKKCYTRQLINGYFPRHQMDFYKEGETATYACNNYFQTEHNVVLCTKNGWFPHPRCIPEKKCRPNYVEMKELHITATMITMLSIMSSRAKAMAGSLIPDVSLKKNAGQTMLRMVISPRQEPSSV
ncbi:coagulation factor XIII B chain-like [Manacus vitellinus]|uniref:coagulation factor XIII B chain-like n=1 Tax=Manacus vitellinus TaxID=328815 RepID=UPI000846EAD6|nr:coagulation factor XIII B chain-like [Manacus vitellinus]